MENTTSTHNQLNILLPDGRSSIQDIKETIVRSVFAHAQHNTLDDKYLNDLNNLKHIYLWLSEMQVS